MQSKFTLVVALLVAAVSGLQAQNRFIDKMYGVSEPTVEVYSTNLDVFNLQAASQGLPVNPVRDLEMDVYQPVGDEDLSLRPVVVIFPTGNFLPRYVNQGLYGTRRDSAVVNLAQDLTARGYVGIGADYRVGWNPRGSQDVRTSTLLQAAYRGGQDAHALARYLRKSVVEDGNPYRIDTSRIVFWGLGTGGYVALTHAFLDDIQEVLDDARFYDENDAPYVNLGVNADPKGLMEAFFPPALGGIQSNYINNPGYSSDVAMSINSNGALGDIDWIDGTDNEPLVLGLHSPNDIFAPFSYGDVIVPTTNDLVVGCVGGTEETVETANANGTNDAMAGANVTDLPAIFSDLSVAVNVRNEAYKSQMITFPATTTPPACIDQPTFDPNYPRSRDNMYPLQSGTGLGSGYNFVNVAVASAGLQAFLDAGGDLGSDPAASDAVKIATVLGGEGFTNANYDDPAAAKTVIDTMVAFFIPRAYIGMNLEEVVGTNDLISGNDVSLEVFPNPADNVFTVKTAAAYPVRSISVVDFNGRVVANYSAINSSNYTINRNDLPRGVYVLRLQFDDGVASQKVVLK